VLQLAALRRPDAVAFRYLHDDDSAVDELTFAQLHMRAQAVAARLAQHVRPASRVLVLCPPGLDYVVALMGCMHAGVVAVPAFPPQSLHLAAERLTSILRSAKTHVALTTAPIRALVSALAGSPATGDSRQGNLLADLNWLVVDATDADSSDAASWSPPNTGPDALALLQYTSGSTRTPRGVMLRHAHLLTNCADMADRVQANSESHVVSWLPPYHDMGLIGCILAPLMIGTSATLMSPLSFLARPARWLQAMSRYRGQFSGGPDFAYGLCARRLTDEDCRDMDLGSWRVAFNGAERVRPETIEAFTRRFAPYGFSAAAMRPCYGLAEATLCVSIGEKRRPPRPRRFDAAALEEGLVREADAEASAIELLSCGPALPGHRIRIVAPGTGRALWPERVGEIWVSGPSVATGYFGEPVLSRTTFESELLLSDGHRYLRTGDLGFLHEGELYIVARLKDLIIIRGRNYYPDDIERAVDHAHPALRPGATVAFQIETAEEGRLVVVQELRRTATEDDPVDPDVVARAVREAVAREFQLPIHPLVLVPPRTIPRTSSGKVQRQQTRESFLAGDLGGLVLQLRTSGAYPRATGSMPAVTDDLESKVQAAMVRHLDVATIQPDEDFFALGGQSLLATRVISELRETLGVDLPLRLIFDAPTPRRLASGVRSVQRHLQVPTIPVLSRQGPLPLSYSQERMLFVHLLDPRSAAYNIAGSMQLEGPLDTTALFGAIEDLVARHEILRASYRLTTDGAVQTLRPPGPIDVLRVDCTTEAAPAATSDRLASEFAIVPFDLQQHVLVRVALHRLAPTVHRLVMCVHHIVADGWSLDVALQDFVELYVARTEGRPAALEPLHSQYVDYAAWQRTFLDSAATHEQLAYWKERLSGAPAFLPFPTDRPRPARQGHDGDLVRISIDADLVDRLSALGRAQGATLFMVMLAAFNVVLSRYTGQLDICVGTPIANRNWRASEALVGTFVNTLVMRTDCGGDPTFIELIARVREVCLGAYDHQDVPFERLVEALQPERDLSHSPLFQVFFDFQNVRFPATETGSLHFSPIPVQRRASQFDMSFGFLDFGAGMLGSIEYRTDIFDRSTIERLATHLQRTLEGAAVDPASCVSQLPMLTVEEERAALEEATAPTDPRTPRFEFVHEAVGTIDPARIAVVAGEAALTYGDLQRRSNQLAHHLQRLAVGPDVCVAVMLERGPELLVTLLATMQAGGAYIPMDPAYPAERLRMMLEDGRPAVVVTQRSLRDLVPRCDVPVLVLEDEAHLISHHPITPPETPDLAPDDLAYVIFTSGSTGRPKGVMVPHRALTNFLHAMSTEPAFGPSDRLLSVTTVSFDIAGLELYLPLVHGGVVDIVDHSTVVDASRLRAHLEHSRPTVMQATPATWRMLIEAGWPGDPQLRILCGGEALPRDLADALLTRGAVLWNMYGPTETTIWSAVHRVEPGSGDVPIGRPIRNTQLYVLDPGGAFVPPGACGELYIGGAGVARGYIGRKQLTDERFVPDPFWPEREARMYRTGDAVRRGRDGVLHFEGRLDRQVKVRGFRIELEEIEARLRSHPFVADATVRVFEPAQGDARLVAYVVARGEAPETAMLRTHAANGLPDYMVPTSYVLLPELPRTANGKLDRAALPDPRRVNEAARRHAVEPATDTERRLVEIWCAVLGISSVGVTDDFFDLGGHSLLAVRLFVRINEEMRVALSIGELFERATIRALAARIDAQLDRAP
jgi:amino acid adenylation domain-containing protein